jgi:hypothetical protein
MKTVVLAMLFGCVVHSPAREAEIVEPSAAAAYLDGRMGWWAAWPRQLAIRNVLRLVPHFPAVCSGAACASYRAR